MKLSSKILLLLFLVSAFLFQCYFSSIIRISGGLVNEIKLAESSQIPEEEEQEGIVSGSFYTNISSNFLITEKQSSNSSILRGLTLNFTLRDFTDLFVRISRHHHSFLCVFRI
jgi:hypothetical protein